MQQKFEFFKLTMWQLPCRKLIIQLIDFNDMFFIRKKNEHMTNIIQKAK